MYFFVHLFIITAPDILFKFFIYTEASQRDLLDLAVVLPGVGVKEENVWAPPSGGFGDTESTCARWIGEGGAFTFYCLIKITKSVLY